MHYSCLVITKEFPTDEVIRKAVQPFNWDVIMKSFEEKDELTEEDRKQIPFSWDWYQIGGRYEGRIKLRINDDKEEYRWKFYDREPRAGRLFRNVFMEKCHEKFGSSIFDRFTEEDYYGYFGFRDGYLLVDGAKISDIEKTELIEHGCCRLIDKDGKAYTTEWWNGHDFIENDNFQEELKKAIDESADCYVCMVDMHD